MPGSTPRFGIRYPLNNELNGATALQNMATDAETKALPASGTVAARPAASAYVGGRSYYNTDTQVLSISDGVRWHDIPALDETDIIGKWTYTGDEGYADMSGGMGSNVWVAMTMGFVSTGLWDIATQTIMSGPNSDQPSVFAFSGSDMAIAGKTLKCRIKTVIEVNNVAPAAGFRVAMFGPIVPVNSSAITFNASVASPRFQTSLLSSPAASSRNTTVSAEENLPADGLYVMGALTTATPTAGSHTYIRAYLQMRYV